MPCLRYPGDELSRIGHEFYETNLRQKVETQDNVDKIISIDIDTGNHEIGDDLVVTANRLLNKPERQPSGVNVLVTMRSMPLAALSRECRNDPGPLSACRFS